MVSEKNERGISMETNSIWEKLLENDNEIRKTLAELTKEIEEVKALLEKKNKKIIKEPEPDICYFPESPELEAAFQSFRNYRRTEKRSAMGQKSITMTVKALKSVSESEAIEALNESMKNGYLGVFVKKKGNSNRSIVDEWANV